MKTYLVGYSADKGGAEALRLAVQLARSSGGRIDSDASTPGSPQTSCS